ncbi:hypothetical protein FJU30_07380 [Affinibrenneria salicis]|uniref:Uncharacterized protein n=1 Tax=Affinibrenneria salicis TaxID=2590031 RepID=A0A5J5G2V6_9GAMM|nr:hypothetical protein FJU30_07380 [Affinibrenneria salicis]
MRSPASAAGTVLRQHADRTGHQPAVYAGPLTGCRATWRRPERARRRQPPAPYYASTLTEQEISQGYVLACSCRLPGDAAPA